MSSFGRQTETSRQSRKAGSEVNQTKHKRQLDVDPPAKRLTGASGALIRVCARDGCDLQRVHADARVEHLQLAEPCAKRTERRSENEKSKVKHSTELNNTRDSQSSNHSDCLQIAIRAKWIRTCVNDVTNAVHSERGLSDVGRHDTLANPVRRLLKDFRLGTRNERETTSE